MASFGLSYRNFTIDWCNMLSCYCSDNTQKYMHLPQLEKASNGHGLAYRLNMKPWWKEELNKMPVQFCTAVICIHSKVYMYPVPEFCPLVRPLQGYFQVNINKGVHVLFVVWTEFCPLLLQLQGDFSINIYKGVHVPVVVATEFCPLVRPLQDDFSVQSATFLFPSACHLDPRR